MSAITAKIVFTGICTFVGIGTNNPAAVFSNATHHEVYLAVSDDYTFEQISGLPADKPKTIADPVSGRDYSYVSLSNVTTEMIGADPNATLDFAPNSVAGDVKEPDSASDLASMHWVPHLQRVWPTIFGNVHACHPDLTSDRPLPAIVRSRFPLTHGRVEVTHVDDGIWSFEPGVMMNPKVEQAIAQEVTQTVPLIGSELFLTTKDLQTGAGKSLYKVGLKQGSNRKVIKILLANVPPEDLLPGPRPCVNPGMNCPIPDDPDPCNCIDEHFHSYYGIYPDPPSLDRQPIPHRSGIRNNKLVQGLRVGGGNCGPSQYP